MTQSRRNFLTKLGVGALALGAGAMQKGYASEEVAQEFTPDEALEILKKGNQEFLAGNANPETASARRRLEIASGQKPFTILVGCSDSRVSPEILFGRRLGELFIVRNAGNVVDLAALGSIEYGVLELAIPLIIVLGHEKCGAVEAAVSIVEENTEFPGSIGAMVAPILPAVLAMREEPGDLLDNAVRENVRRIVERLSNSEDVLTEPLEAGRLKIVGARYDLDSGEVDFSVA